MLPGTHYSYFVVLVVVLCFVCSPMSSPWLQKGRFKNFNHFRHPSLLPYLSLYAPPKGISSASSPHDLGTEGLLLLQVGLLHHLWLYPYSILWSHGWLMRPKMYDLPDGCSLSCHWTVWSVLKLRVRGSQSSNHRGRHSCVSGELFCKIEAYRTALFTLAWSAIAYSIVV